MSRGYRRCGVVRGSLSIDDVIEHVAYEFHLAPGAIVEGNARRYLSEARYAIAWLARGHTNASHDEVAAALNRPAGTAVYYARHGRLFRETDADFRALVDRIGGLLSACRAEPAA